MRNITLLLLLLTASFYAQTTPLVPYRVKNLWGMSDTLGVVKIQPKYTEITDFNYSSRKGQLYAAYVVKKTKNYFAIDEKETVLLPENNTYDSIHVLSPADRVFCVFRGGKAGIFYKSEIVPCEYDRIKLEKNISFVVVKNKKRGLINSVGKLVLPIEYNEIGDNFQQRSETEFYWNAIKNGEKQIVADKKIPTEKDDDYSTGILLSDAVTYQEIDRYMEGKYDSFSNIDDNLVTIARNGKYGLFRFSTKTETITPQYDRLVFGYTSKKKTALFARKENKYGIIDENNQVIVPFEYDRIEMSYEFDGNLILTKGGKIGMKSHSHSLVPAKYLRISEYRKIPGKDWKYFTLFRVKTEKGTGWTGINGIEYFKE